MLEMRLLAAESKAQAAEAAKLAALGSSHAMLGTEFEVSAAMEALEGEVYLREAAEAEVTAMRTAVLQHTEALKAAADDDEATRTEMAEQVENLRKEVVARDTVIHRLREQVVSMEMQRQQLEAKSMAITSAASPRLSGGPPLHAYVPLRPQMMSGQPSFFPMSMSAMPMSSLKQHTQ